MPSLSSTTPVVPSSAALPGAAAASVVPRLRTRVMVGSVWTAAGFIADQAVRFAGNIVLAWLLVPEMLGIMALINVVMVGLRMFSDIGIAPSIVQTKRGDDPLYLNTAWTVQVIRGVALWLVTCVIAWPLSLYFNPQLLYLLPVVGLTALIAGFRSTNYATLSRRLTVGRVVALQNGARILGLAVMVIWAYLHPSVWALVAGGLVGSLTQTVISHYLIPGVRNRFAWETRAWQELYRFGRWIFVSTAITFFAANVDKLMFAKIFGEGRLAVFMFAFGVAQFGPLFMQMLCGRIGFPALSDLYRRDVVRFRQRLEYFRLVVIGVTNSTLLLLGLIGPWIFRWFYPDSYADAAWIVVLLCVKALPGALNATYGNAFLAMGSSFRQMVSVAVQLPLVTALSLFGYYWAGEMGFVIGLACSDWLLYPANAWLAVQAGIWQPRLDLPALLVSGIAGLGLLYLAFA